MTVPFLSFINGVWDILKKYWLAFFAVWFYPIGIWFLQPRITKILGTKNKVSRSTKEL